MALFYNISKSPIIISGILIQRLPNRHLAIPEYSNGIYRISDQ